MKKGTWLFLLTMFFVMTGCSKVVSTNDDKPQKPTINIMKEKDFQVEDEETVKREALDKEELQPEVKKEEIEIDKVKEKSIVATKQEADKKPKTAVKEEPLGKENKKPVEKPIVDAEEETEELASLITKATIPTIDFLLPQKNSEKRTEAITNLVIHFTSNAALQPKDPYDAQAIHKVFIDYGVSAHYMIGREGEIYLLVPENRVSYHAGKGSLKNFPQYKDQLNKYSIGIEMMAIGTKEEMSSMMSATVYDSIPQSHIGYTEAQYQSLHKLINDIVQRNPAIKKDREHIVGHDEYAPNRKSDPGSFFSWAKIGF